MLLPTLKRSAWNSHSESILQTMLCSEDREERIFAVSMILKIRGKDILCDLQPRAGKHPKLNISAMTLQGMIDWKNAKEPVLSCKLSKEEISSFREKPMEVPYFCLHTQGIE